MSIPVPDLLAGRRVLIVENIRAMAMDLAQELRRFGCTEPRLAETCEEALRVAVDFHPELVFMDIKLTHNDDGFDAANRLAELHDIAVIFLSTHSDEDDLRHALAASSFGYVAKPFNPDKIAAAVEHALDPGRRGAEAKLELADLVVTDVVTGAGNRRKVERALRHEWHRCAREGHPLALLMVNLDHFREFNTRSGHASGDACLTEVAAALRAHCIRERDVVARWHGAQFAALLPATDTLGANHVAGSILEAARHLQAAHDANPALTASIGVASIDPSMEESAASLLEKAERALNAAKEQGGNRIVAGRIIRAPQEPPTLRSWLRALWTSKPKASGASQRRFG